MKNKCIGDSMIYAMLSACIGLRENFLLVQEVDNQSTQMGSI